MGALEGNGQGKGGGGILGAFGAWLAAESAEGGSAKAELHI